MYHVLLMPGLRMKDKFITAHMKVASVYAQLSSARRLKVGAIVVKDDRIISIGYNGTPPGWDNTCEDMHYTSPWVNELTGGENITYTLKTRPEVIHAEANAIAKLARSSESGSGSTMFITHAPCMDCAKLIYGAGVNKVYYREQYRDSAGLKFLEKCGVEVLQHDAQ